MSFQFATCEIKNAIKFLKTGYPSRDISEENLPKLKDALSKDIVRITDPNFHRLALVVGNNYKEEHLALMADIRDELDGCPMDLGFPSKELKEEIESEAADV